jgi:Ca2+/Na+ antiporter
MFLVWLLIKVPGKENTARLQAHVRSLLSSQGIPKKDIRIPRKRSAVARLVLRASYLLLFVLTFGLIGSVLISLHFTWVSAAIFLFFLCVVSFFAFRLRHNAREFVVVEGKDSFLSVVMDLLSLPVLRAGQWLSRGISRINVFLFFFDFLFEAPFKMFLTVIEEWFSYLKEKKEELQ